MSECLWYPCWWQTAWMDRACWDKYDSSYSFEIDRRFIIKVINLFSCTWTLRQSRDICTHWRQTAVCECERRSRGGNSACDASRFHVWDAAVPQAWSPALRASSPMSAPSAPSGMAWSFLVFLLSPLIFPASFAIFAADKVYRGRVFIPLLTWPTSLPLCSSRWTALLSGNVLIWGEILVVCKCMCMLEVSRRGTEGLCSRSRWWRGCFLPLCDPWVLHLCFREQKGSLQMLADQQMCTFPSPDVLDRRGTSWPKTTQDTRL